MHEARCASNVFLRGDATLAMETKPGGLASFAMLLYGKQSMAHTMRYISAQLTMHAQHAGFNPHTYT